jgi:hypothetical protein
VVIKGGDAVFDKVDFRMFRGTIKPWEELFRDAAEFASTLRPEESISISHSEDSNDGVVAVWYWTHLDDRGDPGHDS